MIMLLMVGLNLILMLFLSINRISILKLHLNNMISHGQQIQHVFKQRINSKINCFFFIKLFFLFRDLIITSESRPPTVTHSLRTINNGRTSTIPPPSDYEMIIGLLFSIKLILIKIYS
jgi:hypothetical protein